MNFIHQLFLIEISSEIKILISITIRGYLERVFHFGDSSKINIKLINKFQRVETAGMC